MKPVRVQRKRVKGWKMPPNTVYVGRPTKWGNDFRVGENVRPDMHLKTSVWASTPAGAVELYKRFLTRELQMDAQMNLRGKNLACWCPLNKPCHADILLKIANG